MTQQQIAAQTGALGADGNLTVYVVPGSVIATPVSAAVIFDGSGAAGAFLPCLTFRTQTGAVIARCPAPEVAAGATAEVSWFPSVGSSSGTGAGIKFNTDNEGGWLFVDTHAAIAGVNPAYNGSGLALVDGNSDGIVVDSDQTVDVNTVQNGDVRIGQQNNGQAMRVYADLVKLDNAGHAAFTVDGAGLIDAGGHPITNGADGVNPTDFATVEQLPALEVTDGTTTVTPVTELDFTSGATVTNAGGGVAQIAVSPVAGIVFDSPNTGGSLQVTTTSDSTGINLDDSSAGGAGVLVTSDNGSVQLNAPSGLVQLLSNGTNLFVDGAGIVGASLVAGGSLKVYDRSNNPILEVTEDGTYHILTGKSWVADL